MKFRIRVSSNGHGIEAGYTYHTYASISGAEAKAVERCGDLANTPSYKQIGVTRWMVVISVLADGHYRTVGTYRYDAVQYAFDQVENDARTQFEAWTDEKRAKAYEIIDEVEQMEGAMTR